MDFSITTPSYNQGCYIRDCIESVIAQKGEAAGLEFEHIIIDACSTDETVSILKEYPHLTWVSEPDRGQTDAINKGFRKTFGDWVMWLNADDYLLPGALEKAVDFARLHPDADVIYGDCDFVEESKRFIRTRKGTSFSSNLLLFYGCFIPSTACFYHRRVLDAGYYLDGTMKVCMDYEYYLRLAHSGFRFVHLPKSLAGFRWHGANISSTFREQRILERRQLQRHYLKAQGRAWLGGEVSLRLMKTYYRILRRVRMAVESRST